MPHAKSQTLPRAAHLPSPIDRQTTDSRSPAASRSPEIPPTPAPFESAPQTPSQSRSREFLPRLARRDQFPHEPDQAQQCLASTSAPRRIRPALNLSPAPAKPLALALPLLQEPWPHSALAPPHARRSFLATPKQRTQQDTRRPVPQLRPAFAKTPICSLRSFPDLDEFPR
jgi:hypothetical protein